MSNPNFSPTFSSDTIYRGTDMTRCLTDDLDTLESQVAGKAPENHSHDYAPANHTHNYASPNHTHDYAPSAHTHDYAPADHSHTGYASESHTHNEYAPEDHTHSGYASSNHGHSYNDLTDKPTIPSAYSHPASHPASMITGLSDVATSGNYNDLTNKPTIPTMPTIPESLPANGGNADTVDNKHASDFATANHNHDDDYIDKSLQSVADSGSFKYSYRTSDNVNVLDELKTLPSGLFTVYSQTGVEGNPKTTEAWRMLVHKTGDTVLWVKAFGSVGSEYTNYCADGVWQGWRCIFDIAPTPLWTGSHYMAGSHTVTPSKTLSECRNGWMLVWSDYNPGDSVQNVDFVTTIIPKRAYNGSPWNGHQFLCTVPSAAESNSDTIIVKKLHVYNTKIVGNDINNVAPRNDVVLRAVYEF